MSRRFRITRSNTGVGRLTGAPCSGTHLCLHTIIPPVPLFLLVYGRMVLSMVGHHDMLNDGKGTFRYIIRYNINFYCLLCPEFSTFCNLCASNNFWQPEYSFKPRPILLLLHSLCTCFSQLLHGTKLHCNLLPPWGMTHIQ